MPAKKNAKLKTEKTKPVSGEKTGRNKNKQKKQPKTSPAEISAEGILAGNTDKIGTLISKGFDLAEAGISLALNIVNKMGTISPDSFIEKFSSPFAGVNTAKKENAGAEDLNENYKSAAQPMERQASFITNRLPVFPGQAVKVSFTINNDSYEAEKKLKLSVEGFTGEKSSAQFDAKLLSIQPAKTVIQPMDFEKFTLTGTLPADIQPDIYHGMIIVASENETIKIEVRLNVTPSF